MDVDITPERTFLALLTGFCGALASVGLTRVTTKLDVIGAGIWSTIPASIVPTSIGFVVAADTVDVVEALYAIPSGIFLNAFFLTIWKYLPTYLTKRFRWNLSTVILVSILVSILVWSICFWILWSILDPLDLLLKRIAAALSVLVMLTYGLISLRMQAIPGAAHNQFALTYKLMYFLLGLVTFIFIGSSTFVSLENEVAGGLLASFPSVYLLGMASFWLYQGISPTSSIRTISSAVYISHYILGSLSASAYCIIFAGIYESGILDKLGLAGSAAVTALISFFVSILITSLPINILLKLTQTKAESKLSVISFDRNIEKTPLLGLEDDW